MTHVSTALMPTRAVIRLMLANALIILGISLFIFPSSPWTTLCLLGLLIHPDSGHQLRQLWCTCRPALLLLLAGCLPGLVLTIAPSASIKGTGDLLRGTLAGLALLCVMPNATARKTLTICLVLTLLTSLAILLPFATGLERTGRMLQAIERWFATPARLSGVAIVYALILLAVMSDRGLQVRRLVQGIAWGICLVMLAWSAARGPALALLACLVTGPMLLRLSTRWMIGGLIGMALTLPILLFVIGALMQRGTADSGRFLLWEFALEQWLGAPLAGLGNNTLKEFIVPGMGPTPWPMPHNIYIEMLFSGGLMALACNLLGMLWTLGFARLQQARLPAFAVSSLLFLMMLGLVDVKWYSTLAGMYLGISLSLMLSPLSPSSPEPRSRSRLPVLH